MKQGRGSSIKAATKPMIMANGINPVHAASIGLQSVQTKPIPVHTARGIQAPPMKSTSHPKGSQGRS